MDRHYRRTEEISGLAKALEQDIGDAVDFGALQASVGQEGAPVVRLLESVFEDAAQVRASDVHLEPQENGLLIRSRIDGVLQTQTQADKRISAALSQRLKLMAGLDISEKRLPQDGSVYLLRRLRPARRPEGADAARRHAQGYGLQAEPVRRHARFQPARRRALRGG